MPLSRLLYFSENQLSLKRGSALQQLSDLMSVCRKRNEQRDITGALLFDELWFIQCLEGERRTVMALFDQIREDERHSNVSLVSLHDAADRSFGHWWMALLQRNAETESEFEPYLQNGRLNPEVMTAQQLFKLIETVSQLSASRSKKA